MNKEYLSFSKALPPYSIASILQESHIYSELMICCLSVLVNVGRFFQDFPSKC